MRKDEAAAAYSDGLGRLATGDLEGAASAFQASVDTDATFAMGYLGLSQALDRQGKVDAAIEAINQAINLTPDDPLAYASLSRLLQQKNLIEEAEAAMAESNRLSASQQDA